MWEEFFLEMNKEEVQTIMEADQACIVGQTAKHQERNI